MSYINRSIEATVEKASRMFSAVLITGARQVGKTTLLKHLRKGISYITLDDPILLQNAVEEAGSFFKTTPPPVIVDEIQYAPNLFSYIKMIADESGKKGQFYLTGSQQFKMMKNISESLSGRIGIINLLGLSLREIKNDSCNEAFIPTEQFIDKKKALLLNWIIRKYGKLYTKVQCRQCMPMKWIGSCFMLLIQKHISSGM